MASSKLLNISLHEDEVCCPVCFDEFEEPKALPQCLHNFCKKCLNAMMKTSNRNQIAIECPTCRVISVLPEGSVDRLPTNHFLKNLVERIPGRKERLELTEKMQECEKNVKFCEAKHQEKMSSLKTYEEALQRLLVVRQEMQEHAKNLIGRIEESLRVQSAQLDNHITEISSLIAKREQCSHNLSSIVTKTQGYLNNIKALLKSNNREEIIENKEAMEDEIQRLNDSILFQTSDANSLDGNPKEMEFRKMNVYTNGEDLFGVLQQSTKQSSCLAANGCGPIQFQSNSLYSAFPCRQQAPASNGNACNAPILGYAPAQITNVPANPFISWPSSGPQNR